MHAALVLATLELYFLAYSLSRDAVVAVFEKALVTSN